MKRLIATAYGLICYGIFFGTFLYAIGFLANMVVPHSVDSGTAGPVGTAILVDTLLLLLFAVQHSVMARPGFKKLWTRIVPQPVERSTYVLLSSLALILLFWLWRPIPGTLWEVEAPAGRMLLQGLLFAGFGIVLYASFLIDHFDLFGLRQVSLYLRGKEYTHKPFGTPGAYKLVRHPLYVGWILSFWATPVMTYGHLLFSVVATGYIFAAIVLEERDLLRFLGEDYRRYRETTPMIVPWPRSTEATSPGSDPRT